MYRLLHRNPRNRLAAFEGANEVKQHPFFRSVNWALVRCMVRIFTLISAMSGANIIDWKIFLLSLL